MLFSQIEVNFFLRACGGLDEGIEYYQTLLGAAGEDFEVFDT